MNGKNFCGYWRKEAGHVHWGMADKVFWHTSGDQLYATNKTISDWTGAGVDFIEPDDLESLSPIEQMRIRRERAKDWTGE